MDIVLQAKRRTKGARSTLTKLRKEGQLPAVIYGYNVEAVPVYLDYKETAKAVQKFGRTSVFKIDIEGKQVNAVLNEVQRCAMKGLVKHVDFLSINMAEELEVAVPVSIIGEAVGVREGGVLTQPIREITIKVKPSDIPESIEVDVSNLAMNESLSILDIRGSIAYTVVNADEDVLATVTPPVVINDDTAGQGDTENQDIKASGAPESEN
ncbi:MULTISPECIES: 50S ribosomal protein L25/general stress protein Ctc [Lysinibacillus]|uniref:Large ribosomal subunit protein bL25 n=1 Tax=Lysinibacillus antri TaxID=2498145 RepID=A0A3S0R4X3_9BACI|nr:MULTISPECIES: 50S ribosomal protein L25/general stress protein Ctc [Lysinibacillus]RUL49145.1 50S ribosomal protein L25/general stress protein Ctc [Lysinibacillus antri]TSI05467.1 50S ribosomal protein L25/general stress protein Ctc [Lysinibacillus sp. BW-2-10]